MSQTVTCGGRIRLRGETDVCTTACLVRFVDQPQVILMLSVAHGLVKRQATQRDVVETVSGTALGRLRTWTTFYSEVTADIALIWVDPQVVSPRHALLGQLDPQLADPPRAGQKLHIQRDGGVKDGTVLTPAGDVKLTVDGIDWWLKSVVYSDQILSKERATAKGDSGALVVDDNRRVAGMVVGGHNYVPDGQGHATATIITPISTIFRHPDFQGGRLELVTEMPDDAWSPF